MKTSGLIILLFWIGFSRLGAEYKTNTLLFCLNPDQTPLQITSNDVDIITGTSELDEILKLNNVVKIEPWLRVTTPEEHSGDIYLNRIYRIQLSESRPDIRDQIKNDLTALPFIHSIEKEPIHAPLFTPNDPMYNQQWFLPQINANDAWNLWNIDGGEFPGDKDVLLASVDTGVDWDHVDLVNNIWNNPGEDANGNGVTILYQSGSWIYDPGDLNGVDEDENGYVDDLIGWDLAGYSGLQDNIPSPPSGVSNTGTWAHGTHVAGLLSATANNSTGIASVGFNCSIMSVKVSTGEQSYPYITHGYEGILYAAKAGYHNNNFTIINNSWGGIGYNQYEQAVIDVVYNDYGAIIVAAAGNGDEFGLGTDEFAHYPSSYNHVISVCAMGSGDNWNHWATYHASVDLASPGENIRSTRINNGYTSWSGSSMASPIAAGTIGLLRSYNMDWTNEMLETMILATADPVIYDVNPESYLQGKLGRGRVEALMAVSTPLFPKFELIGTDIYIPTNPGGVVLPGNYFDNITPVTGEVYSQIPDSDSSDIDLAVSSAKEAFRSWSKLSKNERYDHIMHLADEIKKHFDELVEAESKDNGKPEWLARSVDIPRASENFRFFATASLHFDSEIHEMDGKALNYTLRQPVGVVGCISPWNLPLYLLTWKIVPALAAGNTVVAKPSEITPMTAYLFSKFCQKADFPKGVINIVHGYGHKVGDALSRHPDVPIISFTGGTATGEKIAAVAAPMFKKLSLEMGGKNPNIIFEDADFDNAVKMSAKAAFSNQGQICLCGSRLFVQESIYDKFRTAVIQETQTLKVGDPKDEKSNLGAVVSKPHMQKILNCIDDAKAEGGEILTGGNRVILEGDLKDGYYIEPTIIDGLTANCKTNQEEIFGPVVSMIPFKTEEEVIEMANSTKYGLSASLFTKDVSRAHRVAAAIDSGIVWVNTWMLRDLRIPFGGMKSSGVGREGGFKSLQFFTEAKNVCIKI